MSESKIQKAIDRDLSFFLRFYLAYDKRRARKLDELVTLIGHSRASRFSLRYQELCDKVEKVIQDNPDEYTFANPYVWLTSTEQDVAVAEATVSDNLEAVALEAPATWPTPAFEEATAQFRVECNESLKAPKQFADRYLELLGLPTPEKSDKGKYSEALSHLTLADGSLKKGSNSDEVFNKGIRMMQLHFARSSLLKPS
jgi:pimeloyl-ACP methyl ester carboxylesterase